MLAVLVYLCACVASDEIRYALAKGRTGGKVEARSQVIQCISLLELDGETGDEDWILVYSSEHSLKVRCLGCGVRGAFS